MKVAKQFRWEGAHRLPWHQEGCQNVHGHSYRLTVELEGAPDARGMVIDFKEIKRLLKPLIDAWDHATLVAEEDEKLLEAIQLLETKHYVLPFDSTSENLCAFVADYLGTKGFETLSRHGIETIRVHVRETETCYAELERPVAAYAPRENGQRAEATRSAV